MVKICLDPGHGGKDPGAVGPNNLKESEVVLLAAHIIKSELKDKQKMIMTRTSDVQVPLANRAEFANREGADFFVSLHCNAFIDPAANGIETYHFPGSDIGKDLATAIQKDLVNATGLRNRGVKEGRFFVLKQTQMPAVLVELAFISNPEEERLLGSVPWVVNAARAIARTVSKFAEGGANQDGITY